MSFYFFVFVFFPVFEEEYDNYEDDFVFFFNFSTCLIVFFLVFVFVFFLVFAEEMANVGAPT